MELTASEIRDNYYSDIDANVFNSLVKADPATVVKDGNIVKIGKYAKFLINIFKNGNLKLEDLPRATEYLTIVYRKRVPLDINKLTSLNDVYELIKDFIVNDGETNIKKLVEALDTTDYKLVYNGTKWYIFTPLTEKGVCVLGSATDWCTSWGPLSTNPKFRERSNRFKYYNDMGKMFIFIDKDDNSIKYQFHQGSSQYMDKNDRGISVSTFFDNNPELDKFFNPEIESGYENLEYEDLFKIIDRVYISSKFKSDVLRVIGDKSNNNIVKAFLNLINNKADNKYELVDEFNRVLSATVSDSDLMIESIANGKYVNMENNILDRSIGDIAYNIKYRDYYVDGSDVEHYYEEFIDLIVTKYKLNIEVLFGVEGIDLDSYLAFHGDTFDSGFVEKLCHSYYENIHSKIDEKLTELGSESQYDIADKFKSKYSKYINDEKGISIDVFLHFLVYTAKNTQSFYIDDLKEFFEREYGLTLDEDSIYEEVNQMDEVVSLSDKDLLDIFERYEDDIIESYLDANHDDIVAFNNSDYDDENESLESTYDVLLNHIYKTLSLLRNDRSTYIKDKHKTLKIDTRRINVKDKTVFIDFDSVEDNINGYVPIDTLDYYILYNGEANVINALTYLKEVLKGMGLNENATEFENELVKIKLYPNKINQNKKTIFIDLTNKETGKTISGSVDIESLPTHFKNYKLFEALNRFKKLI